MGGVSYLRYHRVQSLLLAVMSSKSALNLMSEILKMNVKDSEDVKEEAIIKINTRGALQDFKSKSWTHSLIIIAECSHISN